MLNGGGGLNPDGLSLDLQFATDKTLTARRGPTPTFARASGATEVGPNGLIRYAPENLVLQSQNFSNATWQKLNGATVGAAVSDPFGGTSAYTLNFSSTNSSRVEQGSSGSQTGDVVTVSVYLRADSNTTIFTRLANETFATFNVTTDWQRFTYTGIVAPVGLYPQLNNSESGAKTIYAYGFQVERHTSARTYIPTTTAAVYGPRFDHDTTSPFACRGLLIEEQRANLLTWSEEFNNTSGWSQTLGFATANQTTSPSGNNNADLLSARNISYGGILRRDVAPAYAANTTYTMSVYAKAGTHQFIGLRLSSDSAALGGNVYSVFTLSGSGSATAPTPASGTIGSVSCVSAGGGWYRCTLVYTTGSTAPNNVTDIAICQSNGNANFTPAGTETVFLWGAQVEAGSFATSYIPTTTGTLARSADVCSITGGNLTSITGSVGSPFSASVNFITDLSRLTAAAGCPLSFNTSSNNGVFLYKYLNSASFGVYHVSTNAIIGTLAAGLGKAAMAYDGDSVVGVLNNGTVSAEQGNSALAITEMIIGSIRSGENNFGGPISSVRVYRKRLPNAKLQSLTV